VDANALKPSNAMKPNTSTKTPVDANVNPKLALMALDKMRKLVNVRRDILLIHSPVLQTKSGMLNSQNALARVLLVVHSLSLGANKLATVK
jgi:hypothetical protein